MYAMRRVLKISREVNLGHGVGDGKLMPSDNRTQKIVDN